MFMFYFRVPRILFFNVNPEQTVQEKTHLLHAENLFIQISNVT